MEELISGSTLISYNFIRKSLIFVKFLYVRSDFEIGYGSTIISNQKISKVSNKCLIKREDLTSYYDAAILTVDEVSLLEDQSFMYFTKNHWNLDLLSNIAENKT